MSAAARFTRPGTWSRLAASIGPLLALIAVYALFAGLELAFGKTRVFLSAENLQTIVVNSATVAIAALGMTVVIIAGGIDLSVGCGLAFCATVLASALLKNFPVEVALLMTLLTGCALGALNGITISALRVVPFIVTLGTMTIYLGCAEVLAARASKGAQTVRPVVLKPDAPDYATKNQVPEWLKTFTSTREKALWPPKDRIPERLWPIVKWVRYPAGVWVGLLLAGALAAVLRYTVFGRYVYALGSNEATARLCGINVPLVRIAVYTLSGLFVGIAGIYQFSRLSSGNPNSGVGMELRVIAAVVIGGGSLTGGRGSILGTLAGAAMMQVIQSGCTHLNVNESLERVVLGVIIIAAVTLDQLRQRRFAAA